MLLTIIISFLLCLTNVDGRCKPSTTSVYLMIDDTDAAHYEMFVKSLPDVQEKVDELFPLEKCKGASFRTVYLSDTGQPQSSYMHYDPLMSDSKFDMPKSYKKFHKQKKALWSSLETRRVTDRSKTYIVEPISTYANKLIKEPAGRKIMIIVSDMLENSNHGNLYKDYKAGYLDQVFEQNKCVIGSLQGIEIYVINYRTSKTEAVMHKAKIEWGRLFNEKGALSCEFASSLEIK